MPPKPAVNDTWLSGSLRRLRISTMWSHNRVTISFRSRSMNGFSRRPAQSTFLWCKYTARKLPETNYSYFSSLGFYYFSSSSPFYLFAPSVLIRYRPYRDHSRMTRKEKILRNNYWQHHGRHQTHWLFLNFLCTGRFPSPREEKTVGLFWAARDTIPLCCHHRHTGC